MTTQRPIVGVRITHGLGNQMFMYAAGLAMAERLDAELLCDVSHYRHSRRQDRPLDLPAFGVDYLTGRVPPYKRLRKLGIGLRLFADRFRGAERLHAPEGYDPRFHQIAGSCALTGFFQSWRYFAGHEAAVRRSFDAAKFASERTRLLADEMRRCEHPVAIHVRRGDYASIQDVHPLLRREYYESGREALSAGGRKPTFFLFSDDVQSAADELHDWDNLRPVTFTPLEDLYLMTRCRHFITANSTFSWWAAWLGAAEDKQVVAPAKWFGPAYRFEYDPQDRLVPGWLAIPAKP